jgi:hypothetical protein
MQVAYQLPELQSSARIVPMRALYAVTGTITGLVKLGSSNDVYDRVIRLQSHSPDILKLLAVAPEFGNHEMQIHRALSDYRLHGEWFQNSITREIETHIATGQSFEDWAMLKLRTSQIRPRSRAVKLTPELLQQWYVVEQHSLYKIAELAGIGVMTVQRALKRLGIPRRRQGPMPVMAQTAGLERASG